MVVINRGTPHNTTQAGGTEPRALDRARVEVMMMGWMWLAGALMFGSADAKERELINDEIEEVFVYDDFFARWDRTRWVVETQLGLPYGWMLYGQDNRESRVVALQNRLVLSCEKSWRLSRKIYEVDCQIEDIALKGVRFIGDQVKQARRERLEKQGKQAIVDLGPVLKEWDKLLTGTDIQLQVTDDGRVRDISLEGGGLVSDEGVTNRRITLMEEQLRQLLMRSISVFAMRLEVKGQLKTGQWVEYNSPIFYLPGQDTSRGSSQVIHQLNRYQGHLLVQSKGRGLVQVGGDDTSATGDATSGSDSYKVSLDGVSIYDESSGIMSERVYSVLGMVTGGSASGDVGDRAYFQTGRLRQLGDAEQVDVGVTSEVIPEAQPNPDDLPIYQLWF